MTIKPWRVQVIRWGSDRILWENQIFHDTVDLILEQITLSVILMNIKY